MRDRGKDRPTAPCAARALAGSARAVASDAHPDAAARGRRPREGDVHEVRGPDPDARRREALHGGLRAEGAGDVPDPPLPDALRRRPVRRRQVQGRDRPVGPLPEGGVHLRLPGRARTAQVRGDVRQRPPLRPEQGPEGRRRGERHVRHDRLAPEERPRQQRKGRHLGDLVPRLLRGVRAARLPPGAQGRLAAGPDRRLVPRRRLPPQRRLLPAARLQLLRHVRHRAGRHRPEDPSALRPRHAGRLPLLPLPAAARRGEREALRREGGVLGRPRRARHLRRLLAGADAGAAPPRGEARRPDRRRLVRRRGPLRRAEDLQDDRGRKPRHRELLVMGPWSHGGWSRSPGRRPRRRPLRRPDVRLLPRADRVPVLPVPPEGEGRREARRGVGLRDRDERLAQPRRLAAERDGEEEALARAEGLALGRRRPPTPAPPPSTSTSPTREGRSRSSPRRRSGWRAST